MIKSHWQKIIKQEQQQNYYCQLQAEISKQRAAGISIFPEEKDVFKAFEFCDLEEVKIVILGQDPYHGIATDSASLLPQAHGLAFSVQRGVKPPPSLINIYKELSADVEGFITPKHGNLTAWAEQGVLLLNTVLTVQQGQAHSHAKLGWETFTDRVIDQINQYNDGCVFILWGAHAQKKGSNINNETNNKSEKNKSEHNKHLVLNGPHPSPLSAYRGFFGCQHFSKANTWLVKQGKKAVNWSV